MSPQVLNISQLHTYLYTDLLCHHRRHICPPGKRCSRSQWDQQKWRLLSTVQRHMAQSTDHLPDLRRHTALPRKLPSTDESSPLLLHSDRARMHLSNGCSYLPPDRIDQRHTLNNLLLQAPPLSTPQSTGLRRTAQSTDCSYLPPDRTSQLHTQCNPLLQDPPPSMPQSTGLRRKAQSTDYSFHHFRHTFQPGKRCNRFRWALRQ